MGSNERPGQSRSGLPVINLAGCPTHPNTISKALAFLLRGLPFELDAAFTPFQGWMHRETLRYSRRIIEIVALLAGQWPHSSHCGAAHLLAFGAFPLPEPEAGRSHWLASGVGSGIDEVSPLDPTRINEHVRHCWFRP